MAAPDLSAHYLGLELEHPLMASSSPLTANLDSLVELQRAGAAAVVLPSLFEEQIEHEREEFEKLNRQSSETYAESLSFFPDMPEHETGPERYLRLIGEAKENLDIPVIASLNGYSLRGWTYYAERIEQAGADAIELNIYFVPTDPSVSGSDLERHHAELVRRVREQLSIPVAVKIGPHFTSPVNVACQLAEAGASGLVLFNRFLSPDIDLQALNYIPALDLSEPDELRMALRWIAIIRDHCGLSLAATGGIHSGTDVVKAVMAGADAVMVASAMLKHGVGRFSAMRSELSQWLLANGYDSVRQMRGSMSLHRCSDPDKLKRGNYMKALTDYTTSIGI